MERSKWKHRVIGGKVLGFCRSHEEQLKQTMPARSSHALRRLLKVHSETLLAKQSGEARAAEFAVSADGSRFKVGLADLLFASGATQCAPLSSDSNFERARASI